jgi:hypothetical protein
VLALVTAACIASRPAEPFEVHERFQSAGLPPIDVRFSIQTEHRRAQSRYVGATMASLKMLGEWLGPMPRQSLTIVDPPWHHSPAVVADDAIVLERTAWWRTTTAMSPELAAARGVSRRFWTSLFDPGRLPPWFIDGLTEYAARRVVASLFEQENLPPGYAFVEERFFDRFVPVRLRIRLQPETDGDPIPAYRANPGAHVAEQPMTAANARSLEGKTVLTLGTLERWVGRPVFDQIMTDFVHGFRGTRPTLADFSQLASNVSGQDLTWLIQPTFGGSAVFDYAVTALATTPIDESRFETTVVAARLGNGVFSGTSAVPVGGFQSGRGLTLRVTFADGAETDDTWDGRDTRKTFAYRSTAAAVSAVIDPDRVLLLDLNRTNNSRTLTSTSGVAARRWAARWMLWLQSAMLTSAFFS